MQLHAPVFSTLVRAALLFIACGSLLSACASTECSFNSQCGDRHYCLDGICRQDCESDIDCASGLACNAVGRCDVPRDSGTPDTGVNLDSGPTLRDSGTPDSGPIVRDSGTRDSGPVVRDSGFDAGHDAGTTLRGYLDDCTASPQCESGTCIPENAGKPNVCSKECRYDSECADWHFCLHAAPGDPGVCVFDDIGRSCNAAASGGDCEFSCMFPSSEQPVGHCTHICDSSADCPGGYACVLSDPSDPTSLKACAWVHKACPVDQDQCPSGLGGCGYDPGSQCTGACTDDSDCPQLYEGSYDCGPASGVSFNICRPSTAADGATGETCSSGANCRSGVCITLPGQSVSTCAERCNPTAGCADGFGCNAFTVFGTAALLCAPAGGGRGGDSCSSNSQCRSAFCSPTTSTCVEFCLNGFCPDGFTCRSDSYVVDGIALRSCRR